MPTPHRLPIVNSDDGTWGDILRLYMMKEHYDDGTDNFAENGGHKTVTIRAGTASAGTAPLKFTSGALLTTPEAGAMEFNNDSLYFTQTTSTTRKQVATYDPSGSTGDIYYRDSSGYFTKLGIGSTGNILNVTSGIPAWTATPQMDAILDSNGANLVTFTTTASSGNYLNIKNNIAGFSPTISAVGTSSNIHINLIPKGVSGRIMENGTEVTTISRVQTFTNKTLDNTNTVILSDTNFTLQDDGDATKQLKFDLSGIATSTTRTFAVPNADTTIVGIDTTQTLTNKTINASNNTLSNIAVSNLAGSAVVTASETIASNNNDTTLPTSAAVKSHVDTATAGILSWNEVTGTSQTAAVNRGYITNNASIVTVTLPASAAIGDMVRIAGKGAGGWRLAQNTGQTVHFGNMDTTSGTGGRLDSTSRYDSIELVCITANTDWAVISSVGNIGVT